MVRPLPLTPLNVVHRSRERKPQLSMLVPGGSAGMVEVQVREDHVGDFLAGIAGAFQLNGHLHLGVLDSVDVALLGGPLQADPGIHQDPALSVADQKAAKGERDAIALVGGVFFGPEGLGNDPEHRAAVEGEDSVLDLVQLESANRGGHGIPSYSLTSPSPRSCESANN